MTGRDTSTGERILVGVDGSEASDRALGWASDEARRRGLALHVVTCWSYPMLPWGPYQPPLASAEFVHEAHLVAEKAVEKVVGSDREGLDVTVDVVEGPASLRLLDLTNDAAMVVVGSRGRGGFTGLLLGSVSQHLVEHAPCPVVVVRSPA